MNPYEGHLWLGVGMSREAFEEVEKALLAHAETVSAPKVRKELVELSCSARAQWQRMAPTHEPEIDLING